MAVSFGLEVEDSQQTYLIVILGYGSILGRLEPLEGEGEGIRAEGAEWLVIGLLHHDKIKI